MATEYVHTYPLHLHRDDGKPGLVVATEAEAQDAFRRGFKLWTPAGLVFPIEVTPEPVSDAPPAPPAADEPAVKTPKGKRAKS